MPSSSPHATAVDSGVLQPTKLNSKGSEVSAKGLGKMKVTHPKKSAKKKAKKSKERNAIEDDQENGFDNINSTTTNENFVDADKLVDCSRKVDPVADKAQEAESSPKVEELRKLAVQWFIGDEEDGRADDAKESSPKADVGEKKRLRPPQSPRERERRRRRLSFRSSQRRNSKGSMTQSCHSSMLVVSPPGKKVFSPGCLQRSLEKVQAVARELDAPIGKNSFDDNHQQEACSAAEVKKEPTGSSAGVKNDPMRRKLAEWKQSKTTGERKTANESSNGVKKGKGKLSSCSLQRITARVQVRDGIEEAFTKTSEELQSSRQPAGKMFTLFFSPGNGKAKKWGSARRKKIPTPVSAAEIPLPESTIAEGLEEISQLRKAKEELEQQISQMKAADADKDAEHATCVEHLQTIIDAANLKNSRLEDTIVEIRSDLASQEENVKNVEAESSSLEEQVAQLKSTVEAESERADKLTSRLEKAECEATAALADREAFREKANSAMERHKEAEKNLKCTKELLTKARSDAHSRKQAISRLESKNLGMQAEIKEAQAAKKDLEEKFSALQRVKDAEVVKHADVVRQLESKNCKLETEINSLRNELEDRTELEDARATAEKLKEQITAIEQEKEAEVVKHTSAVAELKRLLSSAESREQQALEQRQSLAAALHNQHQKTMQLQVEIKRVMESMSEIKSAKSAKHNEIRNELDTKISCQVARIQELEASEERLMSEMELMQKNQQELSKEASMLRAKARTDENKRREMHELLQDLRGNIRVSCRLRPHLGGGDDDGSKCYAFPDNCFEQRTIQLAMHPRDSVTGSKCAPKQHTFQFDRVFGAKDTQKNVYEEISHLVQSAIDGYRVCIFAYGQTGSGKTHTMIGELAGGQRGVVPRSAEHIFAHCSRLQEQGWQFQIEASVVEIYNEQIRDLCASSQVSGDTQKHKIKHIKRPDGLFDTHVEGITTSNLHAAEDALQLLQKAMKQRSISETKCNARSSRSHTVFTISIAGTHAGDGIRRVGKLHLVDLAGSERLSMSGSASNPKLLKETQNINRSLSALGNVIAALANKAPHVPFRDSKLTYLLQHSLGGKSKSLMFCNLSPSFRSLNESLTSLWFAEKVSKVQRA